jgi:exopolysaccharide biosynthesis protein
MSNLSAFFGGQNTQKGHIFIIVPLVIAAIIGGGLLYNRYKDTEGITNLLANNNTVIKEEKLTLEQKLASAEAQIKLVTSEDQYQKNKALEDEMNKIKDTYKRAAKTYEEMLKAKEAGSKNKELDTLYAKTIDQLSQKNYQEATKTLDMIDTKIKEETQKTVAAIKIPENAVASNTPPGAGYSQQKVTTDIGEFLVSIIAADLGSTRVIVDTASEGDCGNECPVMPLASYVSRSGAFAGINGTYFCPASYPSCVGKTNSFDLLVMNKNKRYFNSDNNVYSTNPAFIFSSGGARFVGQALQWGRDTGVDAVISNYPTLVQGGNNAFGGSSDPKHGSKGPRSFIANKGNIAYIGIVHGATVGEAAKVLHTMGMENAMNLDSGGSTALWSGGYKAGPGREIPNAVLFVRR